MTTETAQTGVFEQREVHGTPETERVAQARKRYLDSPAQMDSEYVVHFTKRHREVSHWEPKRRSAECHAYALEHLTPVIHDGELLVGNKTRFVRGGVPYIQYDAEWLAAGLADDAPKTETRPSGGVGAIGFDIAAKGEQDFVIGRYLLDRKEKPALVEATNYWRERSVIFETRKSGKEDYPHYDFIEKAYAAHLWSPLDDSPDGRFILHFEMILNEGLNSMIRRCEENITLTMEAPGAIEETAKVHFWRAAIRVMQGTINWVRNYGRLATEMAGKEKDAKRRQELETIVALCASFGEPATSFREALQYVWFMFVATHSESPVPGASFGRFDQYMYPFYKKDIESGKIDESSVLELLGLMRVKCTEMELIVGKGVQELSGGNLFIGLMIGGYTPEGNPADNELSRLLIRAAIQTPTIQPSLLCWWVPRMKHQFLMDSVDCIKTGGGIPAFFNTDVFIKHELMQNPGLGIEFIRKYAAIAGCADPLCEGHAPGFPAPGIINGLKVFEIALNGGIDPQTGIELEKRMLPQDYDSLVNEYEYFIEKTIRRAHEYLNIWWEARSRIAPTLLISACMRGCIERGKDRDSGGTKLDTLVFKSAAMVNVANSLAGIRELFDKKLCDMDGLRTALKANWEGYEKLHQACLAAPKWGNDDDRVDQIMVELFHKYTSMANTIPSYIAGGSYDAALMGVVTPVPFGRSCGATPDGRSRLEATSDANTSPQAGTDTHGPLAVMRSDEKLDQALMRGGLHNMKFLPSVLSGRKGAESLINMVATHFETQRAFQLQFNIVDNRMLRDAQLHPENYRDLIVRFAGFSTLFVEMGKEAQDQVIERTEEQV